MVRTMIALVRRIAAEFLGWEWYIRKLGVRVGSGCRIYRVSVGSEPFLIEIGDRVTITSGVRFITHDGSLWLVRDGRGRRHKYASIRIGCDVFIGVGSIVMPGVTIGDRCVIGAGSVVTKSIPGNSVAVGVPARVIGKFDDYAAKCLAQLPSDSDLPDRASMSYEAWVRACLRLQAREVNG